MNGGLQFAAGAAGRRLGDGATALGVALALGLVDGALVAESSGGGKGAASIADTTGSALAGAAPVEGCAPGPAHSMPATAELPSTPRTASAIHARRFRLDGAAVTLDATEMLEACVGCTGISTGSVVSLAALLSISAIRAARRASVGPEVRSSQALTVAALAGGTHASSAAAMSRAVSKRLSGSRSRPRITMASSRSMACTAAASGPDAGTGWAA